MTQYTTCDSVRTFRIYMPSVPRVVFLMSDWVFSLRMVNCNRKSEYDRSGNTFILVFHTHMTPPFPPLRCSFIGRCKVMEQAYLKGKLALKWRPQGSLAEALRAGAAGIPGVWTPAGANTWIETGEVPMKYDANGKVESYCPKRETKEFDGRKFLWEPAIHPEWAFIKAKVADKYGNCRFATTARNFNTVMGQAAKITVVEAEKIVDIGELHPDDVHLSGVYVNRVIQCPKPKPVFEVLNYAEDAEQKKKDQESGKGGGDDARWKICARAAREFEDGMAVNLGVGMPTEAADLAKGVDVHIQTENGLLGVGGLPRKGHEDPDLIDAGKAAITYKPGAASFDSSESFLQIRGGHLAISMLGAYEVSAHGDLANWMIPGKKVSGMGGAMDLVSNPVKTKIVVLTKHQQKGNKSKIVKECSLPLTGAKCVSRIITEKAVFDVDPKEGLTLVEIVKGLSVDELKKQTDADFKVAKDLKEIKYGSKKEERQSKL